MPRSKSVLGFGNDGVNGKCGAPIWWAYGVNSRKIGVIQSVRVNGSRTRQSRSRAVQKCDGLRDKSGRSSDGRSVIGTDDGDDILEIVKRCANDGNGRSW